MNMKRITVKLGATMILLFLIVLLPSGFVLNQMFSGFYYNQVREDIGQLASRYADAIGSNRDAMTIRMVEMMSAFSEIQLFIVNADGSVLANSGVSWRPEGSRIPEDELGLLISGETVQIEMADPVSGGRFLASGHPIIAGKQVYGAVYVLSSVEGIHQSLQQVKQLLLISGTGAFFLALGFTFVLSRKLSDPLIQMERATRRIAKGDLETRVGVPSNDEIGSLARAINDLAVDLQRYRDTRSEFFANISHELRTPITYLEGYAKVLKDGLYDTAEEKEKYVDIIHQESVRLTRLIHDLFELSKMEEGKICLQMEWIDLTEVMGDVIEKVEPKARNKGLDLYADFQEQLPLVYGDGFRMEQVFMNLLDNAIRYTERGAIKVQMRAAEPNQLVMVIEDSGIGIPAQELPFIFERFYRVEKSRSREHGGTGLGLAIVKQLVEMQGGTIRVSSKAGKGTRFEISLQVGGEHGQ